MSNARRHQEAHEKFNSRDWMGLKELCDPGLVYEDRPREMVSQGADDFLMYLHGWVGAFSNANAAQADYIDAGEWSIARFSGRGMNDGTLGNLPASNRQMNMPFCELLHWNADGKMDRGELYYDQFTMMTQLGMMTAASAQS